MVRVCLDVVWWRFGVVWGVLGWFEVFQWTPRDTPVMYGKATFVCFVYMQPHKSKFKSVQINMKQVSYSKVTDALNSH